MTRPPLPMGCPFSAIMPLTLFPDSAEFLCCAPPLVPGGQLNITESFLKLEDHLKQLQPDPADSATPPQQPWLDGLLPAEGEGS